MGYGISRKQQSRAIVSALDGLVGSTKWSGTIYDIYDRMKQEGNEGWATVYAIRRILRRFGKYRGAGEWHVTRAQFRKLTS
jgi:hypothetical protein